jgi:hypothetical protein
MEKNSENILEINISYIALPDNMNIGSTWVIVFRLQSEREFKDRMRFIPRLVEEMAVIRRKA